MFAAEAPAPASKSRAESEESLATVKRDFDTIKAAREAAGKSTLDLPRLTAPELQTEARRPAAQKPAMPEKKSANWLVDAIEVNKSGARGERGPQENGERLGLASETRALGEGEPTLPGKARAADRKTGRASETAVNPLTSFMAGWMTPQDLALLRPSLGGPTAAESIARGERPREFLEQPAGGTQPNKGAELFAGREKNLGVPTAPRVNPFLESIGLPAVAPALRAAPPLATRAPAAPVVVLSPVESIPTKSKVPEFAKPPEDEKYFKQLKRF